VKTGAWVAHDSGIGAGVDSYFEYLLKSGAMFRNSDYLTQLQGKNYMLLAHVSFVLNCLGK